MILFKKERFVLIQNGNEVTVLDTDNEVTDENLDVFGVEYFNEEDAKYLFYELEPLVRLLNQQYKELKNNGLSLF